MEVQVTEYKRRTSMQGQSFGGEDSQPQLFAVSRNGNPLDVLRRLCRLRGSTRKYQFTSRFPGTPGLILSMSSPHLPPKSLVLLHALRPNEG